MQFYFSKPTFSNVINIAPGEWSRSSMAARNLRANVSAGSISTSAMRPGFAGGTLDVGLSGTHIFSIKRQLTPGAASSDFVGLYPSPVKWRLRGRIGWAKGGFAANAFVNYVDGYAIRSLTRSSASPPGPRSICRCRATDRRWRGRQQ